MAIKKLSDKEKVERVKAQVLRALEEAKNNTNKTEALGFITGQLAHIFATLDANRDDAMGIVFVAVSILDEIDPKPRTPILSGGATQLELKEQ